MPVSARLYAYFELPKRTIKTPLNSTINIKTLQAIHSGKSRAFLALFLLHYRAIYLNMDGSAGSDPSSFSIMRPRISRAVSIAVLILPETTL